MDDIPDMDEIPDMDGILEISDMDGILDSVIERSLESSTWVINTEDDSDGYGYVMVTEDEESSYEFAPSAFTVPSTSSAPTTFFSTMFAQLVSIY
jgi:hypothetical protein